jgi:hypothetical protein
MRYMIFVMVLCVMGCTALDTATVTMNEHREELCYAETIGMDEYDSQIQFDECMTRE